MDSNELHQWMVQAFGYTQGEQAWNQFQMLPEEMKEQVLSQPASSLPPADQMGSLFMALNNSQAARGTTDPSSPLDKGIITAIAHSIASQSNSDHSNNADTDNADSLENGTGTTDVAHFGVLGNIPSATPTSHLSDSTQEHYRTAISTTSLWLDAATSMNPPAGTTLLLSRDQWIDSTVDNWMKLANPIARQTIAALRNVFMQQFGQDSTLETSAGLFAGPVPISLPDNLRDPKKLIEMVGATSFSMQLGKTAGSLATVVFSGFDQGIALLDNAAGAVLPENIDAYAKSIELPQEEVADYLILRELASARLYSSTPWLMPQIQTLVDKYARGISIDADAIEDQLRQSGSISPDGISGAVDISNIAMAESDEQKEAKRSLERILATVEGWIDCVTWQAGQAYLPHIAQLREMLRRRKAVDGPDEQTFQALLGLEIHPVQAREACSLWEKLTQSEGIDGRDAHWKHPDLLPVLSQNAPGVNASSPSQSSTPSPATDEGESSSSDDGSSSTHSATDWDAALDQLLDEEAHRSEKSDHQSGSDHSSDSDDSNNDDSNNSNQSDSHTADTSDDPDNDQQK
jgi:putative hydrolase